MKPNLPRLQRELLLNLGLLTLAAISLAVASALVSQLVTPAFGAVVIGFSIVADLAVVALFGRYLIKKLVLTPLEELNKITSRIAEGELDALAPAAETTEFTELASKFNDMTATLRDAQAELVRSEKLASIGRLAAGVAHEIGNPLGAIANYTSVLEGRDVEPEVVKAIRGEIDRMDRIVRDMLAFARPGSGEKEDVELAELAEHVAGTLRRQGTEGGAIIVRQEGTPRAVVQRHLLEQCILNLVVNALQEAPGGDVEIYVAEVPTGDGGGSMITVSDSGGGVPSDIRDKVFDPFFTTKDPGSGSGLGLAIVSRAVEVHGGRVWIDESRFGGARFNIFLPDTK